MATEDFKNDGTLFSRILCLNNIHRDLCHLNFFDIRFVGSFVVIRIPNPDTFQEQFKEYSNKPIVKSAIKMKLIEKKEDVAFSFRAYGMDILIMKFIN